MTEYKKDELTASLPLKNQLEHFGFTTSRSNKESLQASRRLLPKESAQVLASQHSDVEQNR